MEGLCKTYPAFALRDVSFAVEPGTIMGFIGRNGAGKSTTIKSMLNLVHPDSGRVTMFGQDFYANEPACKQQLGVVLGGVDFYPNKKLRSITNVTRTNTGTICSCSRSTRRRRSRSSRPACA